MCNNGFFTGVLVFLKASHRLTRFLGNNTIGTVFLSSKANGDISGYTKRAAATLQILTFQVRFSISQKGLLASIYLNAYLYLHTSMQRVGGGASARTGKQINEPFLITSPTPIFLKIYSFPSSEKLHTYTETQGSVLSSSALH